jgi:hypothetical protein
VIVSAEVRNAQAAAVTGRVVRVEILGEAGRLANVPAQFSEPVDGEATAIPQGMVLAEAEGMPVEYVAYDAENRPVCRGTCGPKGSGADWEFSRPLIQRGAPVRLARWTHRQE